MWRTRSTSNREQRNTSAPADGGVGDHALTDHTDVTITSPALGDILYYNGTEWVNEDPANIGHPIAAHAEADATHSLTAAANNTWQVVPWSTSLISSVTVCPLSFYTAGGSLFTVPETGYYDAELTIALAADPDLFGATLEFGLFINNSLVRTFYCSSNDWSLSYAGVLEELTANDTVEIKFRRNGAGYAVAVDLSSRSNFSLHKIAAVGFGGSTLHSLNTHTDTNFPSPTNGQVITWDSTPGEWVASNPTSPAHTFGSHSDANANLTSPGAGLDQYVVVWDQASTSFKLVVNPALGSHALNGHTDTNLGSPGAPEDGYVVSWDNGTSKYVLVAPTAPGAHTLDSHSNVTITGATTNHVLQYNGTNWVNQNLVITMNLDDLANVTTTGKLNHDILWWDSGLGKWVDRTLLLGDISNVSTAGAVNGQSLVFNGSTWGPGNPSAASVAAVYSHVTAIGWTSGTARASLASVDTAGCTVVGGNRIQVPTLGRYQFVFTGQTSGAGATDIGVEVNLNGVFWGNGIRYEVGAGGTVCVTGVAYVLAGSTFSILMAGIFTLTNGNLSVVRIGD